MADPAGQAVGERPEQRRTLRVLMLAQLLSGAGLAAGVTVGALLAEDMLDATGLAGLPAALFTLGSAGAAIGVGRLSHAYGRRPGLAVGYAAGALGAFGIVLAAVLDSPWLLFVTLVVYGSGTATGLQARYAGADLAAPQHRGRAISTVLVSTTLGAIVGPNLVGPTGALAAAWDIPRLAGPFLLAGAAYGAAALVLALWLRPDPLILARRLALDDAPADQAAPRKAGISSTAVAVGGVVMVTTQLVMVAVMTMTPVHLTHHGHGVDAAGLVIAIHVAGMFLPSPVTGRLVDRVGPRPVMITSGVVMVASGVLAATAPTDSVVLVAVALALLGLGWNLGLVSGSYLVAMGTPLASRARTQGTIDLFVALAGAGGGLGSGAVVASYSYAVLAAVGAAVSVTILVAALARSSAGTPAEGSA